MILSESSSIVGFGGLKDWIIAIVTFEFANCTYCRARVTCDIRFKYETLFIFMELRSHFKINQLQEIFIINNKRYKLLCSILHLWRKRQFVVVFNLSGIKILVDDFKNLPHLLQLDEKSKEHQKYFKINIASAEWCSDQHF